MLRMLLGNYLGIEAKHIKFRYGKRGKPGIANKYDGMPLDFNLSHSKNLVLYAFIRKREVGIDIEYIRPIPEMAQIVESYFSTKEKEKFFGLSEERRKEYFFELWTRKEAFLKATGIGLGQLTDCFDEISSDGFFWIRNKQVRSASWRIEGLSPATGFSAAYAAEGTAPLKCVFQRG
jgi:4'-phosphopantetheinyl transferase